MARSIDDLQNQIAFCSSRGFGESSLQSRPAPHATRGVMNTTAAADVAVSSMVSRVVPGIGETMADRGEQLIQQTGFARVGRPMMAARIPRRRICPSFAVRSNSSMNRTRVRVGQALLLRLLSNVFLRKINVSLHVSERFSRSSQLVDARRQFSASCSLAARRRVPCASG